MPITTNQGTLHPQQVERGFVLVLVQFIGRGDAKFGFVSHQIQGRIGDVDRAIVGLHAPFVRDAVRQVHFLEDDVPAGRRFGKSCRVIHQHVRTPLIGHAVMLAIDRKPRRVLQADIDIGPTWDQGGVHFLHAFARDQSQRRVARSCDQIETAFVHQGDHFVRSIGGFYVDFAAGRCLEFGHPIKGRVGFAAFDVAGPGDDVEFTFTRAQCRHHIGQTGRCGKHRDDRRASGKCIFHVLLPVNDQIGASSNLPADS